MLPGIPNIKGQGPCPRCRREAYYTERGGWREYFDVFDGEIVPHVCVMGPALVGP